MYDVIIIGAGAAGLMAAGVAARDEKSVLLLEKMEKPGRKIGITGKGKCNLTNMKEATEFLSKIRANVDFFTPSFRAFDNEDLVSFFKRCKVNLTVERGGRVFPTSEKAWDISDALVYWCNDKGVEIQCKTTVTKVIAVGGHVFGVEVTNNRGFTRRIETSKVIICTGGASYPGTGSTGDGYMFAHSLGHKIEEIRPALVPLEYEHPQSRALEGVWLKNVDVTLYVDGEAVRNEFGEVSFSNRGIEGAVILRMSREAVDALIDGKHVELAIDMKSALTKEVIEARIEREMEELPPVAKFSELLRKLLPRPLVEPIAKDLNISPTTQLRDIGEKEISDLIDILKCFKVQITDYRPFSEAIITAGGVDVTEVNPTTMQSKLVKGLYFAGEVLDIDADTGGYNLQVAFSTGALAGRLLE